MIASLYAFDISNPGHSARLMLERKGVPYRYRKLPPGLHAQIVRMLGFPASTVPALKIDGEKVQGSRELSRWLEQRIPEPPLFPSDPSARLAVEEAERWGDEYLQDVPRFILRFGGVRSAAQRRFIAKAEGLPLPGVVGAISLPSAWDLARRRKIDELGVRRAIEEIPATITHIDGLISSGVIGGEEPNAADFQIAPSLRLLMAIEGIGDAIEGSPAADHARRFVPEIVPEEPMPWVLPRAWLAPLTA